MAKKIVITSIAIMFLSLFCGFCFAADEMKADLTNLGNEVESSAHKAGQSVRNITNDVMSGNIINKAGQEVRDMGKDVERGVNNISNKTVGAYNTVKVDAETTLRANNMDNTTWIWMIIAILAVATISMVWYYAAQNNERK